MTGARGGAAMALVLVAALFGTIGTGLIFTALADHRWAAAAWGLPLALGGLYWCGRARALGRHSLSQRRLRGDWSACSEQGSSGSVDRIRAGGPVQGVAPPRKTIG